MKWFTWIPSAAIFTVAPHIRETQQTHKQPQNFPDPTYLGACLCLKVVETSVRMGIYALIYPLLSLFPPHKQKVQGFIKYSIMKIQKKKDKDGKTDLISDNIPSEQLSSSKEWAHKRYWGLSLTWNTNTDLEFRESLDGLEWSENT